MRAYLSNTSPVHDERTVPTAMQPLAALAGPTTRPTAAGVVRAALQRARRHEDHRPRLHEPVGAGRRPSVEALPELRCWVGVPLGSPSAVAGRLAGRREANKPANSATATVHLMRIPSSGRQHGLEDKSNARI